MKSALLELLVTSRSTSGMKTTICNEGSDAGHRASLQHLLVVDTILCIAGGIGAADVLGFVQDYSNKGSGDTREGSESLEKLKREIMRKAKRSILAWSAREMALIECVKENFLASDVIGELDDVRMGGRLIWMEENLKEIPGGIRRKFRWEKWI
ncbi:hypothetical protein BHYA_0276g00180 [Botrytis hyacinthi]|uniref:Uncharacterized protein n=1 Tax=Botrytis hyacinthi TaxID=278943 RepID=A0A4Z1GC70_9HELO|nr:hypothetical protein BHYA_0276g00180 [Botrytis hyacinthi]